MTPARGTPLLKLLANLGHGSRKQVAALLREGRATDAGGQVLYADDRVLASTQGMALPLPAGTVAHADVRVDGAPLDPPQGLLLVLHKPVGVTCSHKDAGRLVFDLLPPRFRLRSPALSTVGRLDRDTSGLLLLTDDGQLLHRIIAPKSQLPKVYEATLAQPLRGDEASLFASGTLLLEAEKTPLLPARLDVIDPLHARLTLHEGRYHQVRRMFAAVGNHVTALHRSRVGGLGLEGLPEGQWRMLEQDGLDRLFALVG